MALHINMFQPDYKNVNRRIYPIKNIYKHKDCQIIRIQATTHGEVSRTIEDIMVEWDEEAEDYKGIRNAIIEDMQGNSSDIQAFYLLCFKPKELENIDMTYTALADKLQFIVNDLTDNNDYAGLIEEYDNQNGKYEPDVIMNNYISGMYTFILISMKVDLNGNEYAKYARVIKYDNINLEYKSLNYKIEIPEHIVSPDFVVTLREINLYKYFNIINMDIFSDDKLHISEFKAEFETGLADTLAETILVKKRMQSISGSIKTEFINIEYVKNAETNPKIIAKIKLEIPLQNSLYKTGGELEYDIETTQMKFIEEYPKGGSVYNINTIDSNITESKVYNFDEYFKK